MEWPRYSRSEKQLFLTRARTEADEEKRHGVQVSGAGPHNKKHGDEKTTSFEDHKCAHMYMWVGGMMTDVHVAIL